MGNVLADRRRIGRATGILVLVAVMAWATPAAAYNKWQIVELSTTPSKEVPNGSMLTARCSYQLVGATGEIYPGGSQLRVIISDNGVVKDSAGVADSSPGKRSISYTVIGPGPHAIQCKLFDEYKTGGKFTQTLTDQRTVNITVVSVPGEKPAEAKWPTAPIIVTPGQNQKILSPVKVQVKSLNPSDKKCTDGGVLSLYKEMKGPKVLSSPLPFMSCKAEGAIWELNLIPGVYQIKARQINSKYNFESAYSAPVTFEVIK